MVIKLEITQTIFGRTCAWLKDGLYHRDNDQPAIIYAKGSKFWHQNGEYHRNNDQPAVILANGIKQWYQNGKFINKESK